MATMSIRVTVQAKGLTWSRTATVEVDTAQFQQGNNTNVGLFGVEGSASNYGTQSYTGIAVGVVANKAKGSVAQVSLFSSAAYVAGAYIQTHLPFIFYSGAGGGFTGAVNGSATATDLPTVDVEQIFPLRVLGSQNIHSLAGLKTIS